MSAGLWGGRSRHTAKRKVRSQATSRASTSAKKKEEGDVPTEEKVKKPDQDELRQRRISYYALSPEQRRRQHAPAASIAKTKSKTSASSSIRSATTSDRKQKRKHKSKASKPGNTAESVSESQRRTEDYVYGATAPPTLESIAEETNDGEERRRSDKRSSKHSTSSRRRTVLKPTDVEVTPDDSISQVAERVPERRMTAHDRPSLKRSSTTSMKLDRVVETSENTTKVTSSKRSSKRESTLLGSVLRRHSTTSVPLPPRLVECLTCGSDDVPSAKSAKLTCGHRMCHECLKRIFEMSVKDPAHMPPKCCTEEHIPLAHVDKLFDIKFKTLWNRKYQEYHTKNRIYCPTPKCGHWIKPSHIHSSHGRKYALCPRCKTKVCTICSNKTHKSSECPKDPEIAKLVEQAKEKGWQRCYSCKAMVEKKEGCNHITCRCTAEFCIVCGSQWKTCDCPWFNYSQLPNPDRLNDMRVPENIQVLYRRVFRAAGDAVPPPPGVAPADQQRRSGPPAEVTYQQEMEQRRRQERLDADLARRLQLASLMEPDDERRVRNRGDEVLDIGNAARHFMNDDFVQNAANVVMNALDGNMGRRGERSSGRRRRTRRSELYEGEPGLAPNFLGDESVLGAGPGTRPERARDS